MNREIKVVGKYLDPHTRNVSALFEASTDFGRMRFALHFDDVFEGTALKSKLFNSGYIMPRLSKAKTKLLDRLRRKVNKAPQLTVTSKAGWIAGKQFVLPDRSFGPNSENVIHVNRTTGRVRFPAIKKDPLNKWKSAISKMCKNSDLAIFILSLPFTGPLIGLDSAGAEIAIFNIFGGSSSGKSILLIATTIYGNDDHHGSLINFKLTETGAEETLVDCNHLFLAIDEEGLMESEVKSYRRKFALSWIAGRSKTRSKRYSETERNTTFLAPIATSSNSTAEDINLTQRDTPLAVRWIDIPVTDYVNGDIFSKAFAGRLSSNGRSKLLRKILHSCLANQRAVGLKYIKILSDVDRRAEFLKATKKAAKRFGYTYKLRAAPSLIRIIDKFAVVFAVASCLPALGLVPWTKKQGERAIDAIFLRYMDQRSRIADTGKDVLKKLCELIGGSKHFRFQRNVKVFSKFSGIGLKFLNQKRKVVGICRTSATASAGVERELQITLEELEKLLRSHELLVRNRQNKYTLSLSVKNGSKGSLKSRFMPIDYLKLRTLVGPLKAAL